ncbi:MAG: nitroreductase family protein [Proteobacteria bacterium]|nr:nitroreductase family protein [Pseudomonadota bacterium]
MTLLTIDHDKCKKDGLCALDCPVGLIRMDTEGDGFPVEVAGAESACLKCGHCMAVCPHGALTLDRYPGDAFPEIDKELTVGTAQAIQFLRTRRSIRHYKDRPVEKATIESLIQVARYAPTAGNSQSVQWTVFTNPPDLKTIAQQTIDCLRDIVETQPTGTYPPYFPLILAGWDMGVDTVLRGAPALLVASAPQENLSGLVDVTLALSYLELVAVPMGLGTCWVGLVRRALTMWKPIQETIDLPQGHVHFYPMMLGHPQFRYHRLPERREPTINWR